MGALIQEVNANFDAVVISDANSLRPDGDGSGRARFIEGLTTKILLLGSGLQNWFEPGLDNLQPGMRRLLEVADRKADIWAVRGERTNTWLKRSGIQSAVTTDCPSLYSFPRKILSLAPKYAALKRDPQTALDGKILTAGYLQRGLLQDETKIWRARDLSELLRGRSADYVFQGEVSAFHQLKNEQFLYDPTTCELDAATLQAYFRDHFGLSASFRKYLFFLDATTWRATASQYDIYVGDRLHGGIAAMHGGTPAVLLYHDDRVKEIADFFLIPNFPMQRVRGMTLTQVVSEAMAESDEDRFVQNYSAHLSNFVSLFEGRGFTLRPHVRLAVPQGRETTSAA